MTAKIYEFDRELQNMILKPDYVVTIDGKKLTYRLVEGDGTLNIKEQSEDADVIRFRVNTQQMRVEDETTQQWLEHNPLFKSGKIKIYDPRAKSIAKSKEVTDNLQTLLKVSSLSTEDLLGLGYRVFGRQAFLIYAESGIEGLRVDMITYANVNAEEIETKLSESSKDDTWASLAFVKEIIKEDGAGNAILWGSNGAHIVTVVKGQTPLDAVVEYFKTDEGKEVKKEIGLIIQKQTAENKVANAKKEPAKK